MKIQQLIVLICMIFFLVTTVSALPIPHSIKGIVFDLDGSTQVEMRTEFLITNTATQENITGTVGKGAHTGRYSISIKGYDGDQITMIFWNKYHTASRNLTLEGVMDHVDLILNDSFPNNPPVIFSKAKTQAVVGKKYYYDVNAFDNEDAILEYKILHAPEGMSIDSLTGLISWIPQEKGLTTFTVSVTDSDGLSSNQTSNVRVIPRTISKKVTRSRRSSSQRFFLQISQGKQEDVNTPEKLREKKQENNDTNTKQEKKENTKQNNDFITGNVVAEQQPWRIIFGRITSTITDPLVTGEKTSSVISVTDTKGNQEQFLSFSLFGGDYYIKRIRMKDININVKRHILTGNVATTLNGFFNRIDITLNETLYADTPDTIIDDIAYYTQRPFPILKSPEKLVYKYLIDSKEDKSANFTIQIPHQWFISHSVTPQDIAVYSYINGTYDERYVHYEKTENKDEIYTLMKEKTDNYFVVTIKDEAYEQFLRSFEEQQKERVQTQKITKQQPFLIRGIAYAGTQEQFPAGVTVVITNKKNNMTTQAQTGIANNSGAFSALIEGERGDRVSILVQNENKRFYREVFLDDDIIIGREE